MEAAPLASSGQTPSMLQVACGDKVGQLVVAQGRIVLPDGQTCSPPEFEKLGGRAATKKWKQSIRVVAPNGTPGESLGEWLVAHGIDIRGNCLTFVMQRHSEAPGSSSGGLSGQHLLMHADMHNPAVNLTPSLGGLSGSMPNGQPANSAPLPMMSASAVTGNSAGLSFLSSSSLPHHPQQQQPRQHRKSMDHSGGGSLVDNRLYAITPMFLPVVPGSLLAPALHAARPHPTLLPHGYPAQLQAHLLQQQQLYTMQHPHGGQGVPLFAMAEQMEAVRLQQSCYSRSACGAGAASDISVDQFAMMRGGQQQSQRPCSGEVRSMPHFQPGEPTPMPQQQQGHRVMGSSGGGSVHQQQQPRSAHASGGGSTGHGQSSHQDEGTTLLQMRHSLPLPDASHLIGTGGGPSSAPAPVDTLPAVHFEPHEEEVLREIFPDHEKEVPADPTDKDAVDKHSGAHLAHLLAGIDALPASSSLMHMWPISESGPCSPQALGLHNNGGRPQLQALGQGQQQWRNQQQQQTQGIAVELAAAGTHAYGAGYNGPHALVGRGMPPTPSSAQDVLSPQHAAALKATQLLQASGQANLHVADHTSRPGSTAEVQQQGHGSSEMARSSGSNAIGKRTADSLGEEYDCTEGAFVMSKRASHRVVSSGLRD